MFTAAFLVLLILKLAGLVAMTWFVVFIPLLLAVGLYAATAILAIIIAAIKLNIK